MTADEKTIRFAFFISLLVVLALWEAAAPRRGPSRAKGARWLRNIGISMLDTFIVRLAVPIMAVQAALISRGRGWGLLNAYALPDGLELVLAVLALDLTIYLQHVMFHSVPLFWRFHRMHHADLDFDASTGVRFHPIEIVLSMLIKNAAVVLIGPSPAAVIAFEIILNGSSLFNHSDVRIPLGLDRRLRWLLVTPDMHRVHHSVHAQETNSNFSFNFPWWDRLFGTYRAQPKDGHERMAIGLHELRDERSQGFAGMLAIPFKSGSSEYPITR